MRVSTSEKPAAMRTGRAKKGGLSATIAPMPASGRRDAISVTARARSMVRMARSAREPRGRMLATPRPDKRAQKAIDPDNPFAKLMALKAQMEEEGQR